MLKNLPLPDVSMPDVSVPDASGLVGDIMGLAESAADAISSAAGHVPGLSDYRSGAQRRRRVLWTIGAIGAIAMIVTLVKKNRSEPNEK